LRRRGNNEADTVVAAPDQDNSRRRNSNHGSASGAGHHHLVAQPRTEYEGPVAAAEAVAAQISTPEHFLGRPAGRWTADHRFSSV
jgi:hypothetical protein